MAGQHEIPTVRVRNGTEWRNINEAELGYWRQMGFDIDVPAKAEPVKAPEPEIAPTPETSTKAKFHG